MTAPATTTATMTATQPHTTATTLANTADGLDAVRRTDFTLAHDRSYAARLARRSGDAWFPERWTLDGPEPYAVELPGHQPEEPDSDVLPLADGRVLIRRFIEGRHTFSLLYPTGPGTGEVPLGGVECERLTLLPPAPGSACAYALAPGEHATTVWLVAGGAFGPEYVTEVPGRCTGGVWLDRTGRMLALDRETDGVTKAVAVDLERGGEVTPLLQITDDSDDRLLLADADSGLLLVRSNAPGYDRLGWGVLGSRRPVRFPECLRLDDTVVSPFAVQPGQVLMPETCGVALRIDGAAGSLAGGVAARGPAAAATGRARGVVGGGRAVDRGRGAQAAVLHGPGTGLSGGHRAARRGALRPLHRAVHGGGHRTRTSGSPWSGTVRPPDTPVVCKPVPLQQAPLNGRPQAG